MIRGILPCLWACLWALAAGAQTAQNRSDSGSEKERAKPAATGQKQYQRKGGRTNRSPTDTRIKSEGVKLPPCAMESREGVACPK